MGFDARHGRWPRAGIAIFAALGLLACEPRFGPELPLERRLPLAMDSARSLWVDPRGGVWLGGPEGLLRAGEGRDSKLPVGGAVPRVVGEMSGRVFVRAGEQILALDPATGGRLAEREVSGGATLLDVRGRWVIQAGPQGEVLGLDPDSLSGLWIWPSLGEPTAAALSPEGDRVYLAVAREGGAATLLSRDLQTGRAVAGEDLAAPLSALRSVTGGRLAAVVGEEGEETVVVLDPSGGRLRPLWRRSLRSLGLEAPAELRVDPAGRRLALFSPGHANGLRVLDAEAGEVLGSERRRIWDAAFGPDGSLLFLLGDAEVRVVRTMP